MTMMTETLTPAMTMQDRNDVKELIYRFAYASDFVDWNGLANLFTHDVVTEMDGQSLRFEGLDAQIVHAKESDKASGGKNRHYYFNMIIDGQGDTGTATYAFLNVYAGKEIMKARIICSGRQVDTVTRTVDGWRIAHRRVTFDQELQIDW